MKKTKTVKEPKTEKKGLCKTCNHFADLHYGSEKNWCNQSGCQCQALEQDKS